MTERLTLSLSFHPSGVMSSGVIRVGVMSVVLRFSSWLCRIEMFSSVTQPQLAPMPWG